MGILPLLPNLTSGISAPRMQYTISVLLPIGESLPQSPPSVSSTSEPMLLVFQLVESSLSINRWMK